jgi:hypothetical protein
LSEGENLNRALPKNSHEDNRTRVRTATTPQIMHLATGRIAADLLRTAGINKVKSRDAATRQGGQTEEQDNHNCNDMNPWSADNKKHDVKRSAVPKGRSGPNDKARGQNAGILRGPGPSNGPTNCWGSVKYRKNGMGLADWTYYLFTDQGLCKAYTKPRAPMHRDCRYWIAKRSLKRLL